MTLCRSIIEEFGVELHSPQAVTYATHIFRYLAGMDTAFKFQRNFKGVCVSAKNYRLSLATKSYFSVNLKYAFIAAGLDKLTPEVLARVQKDFRITHNDMVMLKKVLMVRGLRSQIKTQGYRPSDVTPLRRDADFIVFRELYPAITRVIKSITYKRMRFISSSTNTEFSDLNSELACKALSVFYSLMPLKQPVSVAYLKNYILRAINNHAVNIIQASTSAKAGRLVQGAKDGFGGNDYDLVIVSNNQIKNEEGDVSYDDLGHDGSDITETLDFDRLMRRYGDAPNRRAFLLLVTGHDDPAFTEYLRSKRCLRAGEDSEDYYNRAPNAEYMARMNEFLGIDAGLSRAFLSHLGKALGK